MTLLKQLNHQRNGRPEVVTFGVNYDGKFDTNASEFMSRMAALKYPKDDTNRSYLVSRQRWISHYARRIQQVVANGAAPAISLGLRNLLSTTTNNVLLEYEFLEPPSSDSPNHMPNQIPTFHAGVEAHEDTIAYESLNQHGVIELEPAISFNDQETQFSPTVGEHGVKDGDVARTRTTSENRRTRRMDEAEYQHSEKAANITTNHADQQEMDVDNSDSSDDQEIQLSPMVVEHGDKDRTVALTRKTNEDGRTHLTDDAEFPQSQHPVTAANVNTFYAALRETDLGDSDFHDGDNDETSESIDIDRIAREQAVHNVNQTTQQQDEGSSIASRMKRRRGSLPQSTSNSQTSDSTHESSSPKY